MEKFILISTMIIEDDLEANVCLRPSNPLIDDYIATYRTFENESIAISETPAFIAEMTPLLFADFQKMDNIPQITRDQFEL